MSPNLNANGIPRRISRLPAYAPNLTANGRATKFHYLFFAAALLSLNVEDLLADDVNTNASIVSGASPNWTGWFLGGSTGYSWARSDLEYDQDGSSGGIYGLNLATVSTTFGATGKFRPETAQAGIQGGYNRQYDKLVLGLIADLDYRNGGDDLVLGPLFPPLTDFLEVSTDQEWLGTLRGRAGFSPSPSWLIYATGGLGYGRVSHSIVQTIVIPVPGFRSAIQNTLTKEHTKIGWTVGGGVEYRFGRRWSVGAEYLYVDLGSDALSGEPRPGIPVLDSINRFPTTSATFRDVSSVARATISLHF